MASKMHESASTTLDSVLPDSVVVIAGGCGLCGIPQALIEAVRP